MSDQESFISHLVELRQRLVRAVAAAYTDIYRQLVADDDPPRASRRRWSRLRHA